MNKNQHYQGVYWRMNNQATKPTQRTKPIPAAKAKAKPAEFNRFVAAFGVDKATELYLSGVELSDALAAEIESLRAENRKLKGIKEPLRQRAPHYSGFSQRAVKPQQRINAFKNRGNS